MAELVRVGSVINRAYPLQTTHIIFVNRLVLFEHSENSFDTNIIRMIFLADPSKASRSSTNTVVIEFKSLSA